jgi:predicted MFS family arabinose efflux permease
MEQKNERHPEGHFVGMWMAIGVAIGAAIGIPLGFAIGNPGLFGIGLPVGLALGLSIGSAIEAKYKKEGKLRPLTEEEKRNRKSGVVIGMALLLIGVGTFLFIFFTR